MLNNIPVGELSADEKKYLNAMVNESTTVGNFLFKFHTTLFYRNYRNIVYHISDFELLSLYDTLYANLHDSKSVMNCSYSQVNWNELDQYIII